MSDAHERQVLDGRNRYRACMEIGIEPMTRPWDGKGDPLDFVVSKNLHRRHLDESQRAMVADKIATLKKGRPEENASIDAFNSITQSQAAEMMNVSRKSVQRARVVRERGVPELAAAVESGNVSLSAAAAVAYMPEEEQREIVSQGRAVSLGCGSPGTEQGRDNRQGDQPCDGASGVTELEGLFAALADDAARTIIIVVRLLQSLFMALLQVSFEVRIREPSSS